MKLFSLDNIASFFTDKGTSVMLKLTSISLVEMRIRKTSDSVLPQNPAYQQKSLNQLNIDTLNTQKSPLGLDDCLYPTPPIDRKPCLIHSYGIRSFVSYKTRFSQVFSNIIQLRKKTSL